MISNYLMTGNYALTILYDIMFFFDKIIYNLSSVMFQIFSTISEIRLAQGVAGAFVQRMYGIIALVMVFVLAYNLLLYIINPDKLTDKSTGGVAILKKIVIALMVVVVAPYAFDTMYEVQNVLLADNVVGNIVLGNTVTSSFDENEAIKSRAIEGIELQHKYLQHL